ncbi:glutathione S-transferase 1-like isoform X2 [Lytechinus pictus]|uniref:glutathione S-transferase 1-like isoform X2 n=1 Tax=Lytechinus pictus TaxID=7653 RepID=UPI0030BA099B
MPQYKLMYFDARGRAEVIRMLFTLKGVEFEDFRMKREEWPAMKDNKELFPLGQVPILVIDGKTMPHGKAINRYLARTFGYYGKTEEQTNTIELVSETVDDIIQKIYPIFYDKDEEKKITLGDLIAFTIFDAIILTMKITDILDPYPELAAFYKRFNEDSPLSSYIKSRPVTFF